MQVLDELLYKLGFSNEQQFLSALDNVFRQAEREGSDSGKKAGQNFGSNFANDFKSAFSGGVLGGTLGGIIGGVVAGALSKGLQATKQFATESVNEFRSYEAGLAIVAANTDKSLGDIEAQTLKTAEATKIFSKTDVSVTLAELTKAGFSVNQAFELIEKSAKLAQAQLDPTTGEFGDLLEISTQTGSVLRAFNFDFEETARVSDVVAKAAGESSASVTGIVSALTEVGPFASKAGLSLEDVASSIATLTNKGIPAEQAATGLRTVLSSLIDPPKEVRKEFDRLGISLIDASGKARPYNEVLANLKTVTDSGTAGTQLLARGMDTLAISIASSLGSSGDEVNAFAGELDDAEGSAQALADTVGDTTAVTMGELEARARDAKAELGEQLAPVMVHLYENVLPPLVTGVGNLVSGLEGILGAIQGLKAEAASFSSDWQKNFAANTVITDEQQASLDSLSLELTKLDEQQNLALASLSSAPQGILGNAQRALSNAALDKIKKEREALQQQFIDLQREIYETQPTPPLGVLEAPFLNDGTSTNNPPTVPLPGVDTNTTSSGSNRNTGSIRTTPPPDPLLEQAKLYSQRLNVLKQEREAFGTEAEAYKTQVELLMTDIGKLYTSASTDTQRSSILSPLIAAQNELDTLTKEQNKNLEEAQQASLDATSQWVDKWVTKVEQLGTGSTEALAELEPKLVSLREELAAALNAQDFAGADLLLKKIELLQSGIDDIDAVIKVKVDVPEGSVELLPKVTILGEVYDVKTGTTSTIEPEVNVKPAVKVEIPEAGVELLPKVTILGDVYDKSTGTTSTIEPEVNVKPAAKVEIPEAGVELLPKVTILGKVFDPKTGTTTVIEPEVSVKPKVNFIKGAEPVVDVKVDVQTLEAKSKLEKELADVALSFPKALIAGVQDGDIGGALQQALGSASDFFLNKMLEAILGPIAAQLTASITSSVAAGSAAQAAGGAASAAGGAANAAGGLAGFSSAGLLIGGGIALLSFLFSALNRPKKETPEPETSSSSSGSAPAVNYNLYTYVTVNASTTFKDPAFYQEWRDQTTTLVVDLLRAVKKETK